MSIDYVIFLREACKAENNLGVSPYEIHRDIEVKRRIIKQAGYPSLNGNSGARVPISKVKYSTIGKVYRDIYDRAEKKLAEIPEVTSEDGRPISLSELEIAQDVFIADRLAGDSGYPAVNLLEEARKLHKYAITHSSQ